MGNLSLNKEPLVLAKDTVYIVIDVLYINHLRDYLNKFTPLEILGTNLEDAFPYCETPFAEFYLDKNEFYVDQIKALGYELAILKKQTSFSTDTGLIAFVEMGKFFEAIVKIDYYELVDGSENVINLSYWERISSEIGDKSIGLILAPEIGSGYDFAGSGTYTIV